MTLGEAITSLRKKRQLLQKDLALKANISSPHLSLIEKDKTDVNLKTLASIAEALEVPLPVLFFFTISEKDVPEDKKADFQPFYSLINGLVENVFMGDINKKL
jgi:transcriptional regulator with XRE-family HTH domain